MKTLIVVSGGDAPGINAAAYRFTTLASHAGDQVAGAVGGFPGVLNDDIIDLSPVKIAPFVGLGGSWIATSREPVLKADDAADRLRAVLNRHQVDNVLLFGGDGSLKHIPPLLAQWGIPTVGIPSTIDNDVAGTEMTLGYDSACNAAITAIDGLVQTALALRGRVFTVETLGGSTGQIAVGVAHAVGAHAVLIPEYPYDETWLAGRVRWALAHNPYALIIVSEGIARARQLPDDLLRLTGMKARDTRLGHGQRGAPPSYRDRALAADFAAAAYAALRDGVQAGVVVVQGGRIGLREGTLAGLPAPQPDRALYDSVNGLS